MADQTTAFTNGGLGFGNRVYAPWLNDANRRVYSVATITALRALTITPDGAIFVDVRGWHAADDGGGGFFFWDAASTESDDGGLVIKSTSITTGRWKRFIVDNKINPKWFGAKGDDSNDDFAALQAAWSAAAGASATEGYEVEIPPGTYRFTPTNPDFGIYVNQPVVIRGSGKSKTVLKNMGGTTAGLRFGTGNCGLYNLTLDQNGSTGKGVSFYGQYSHGANFEITNQGGTTNFALELDGCSFSIFSDVQIHTSSQGIRFGATVPTLHSTLIHTIIEPNEGKALTMSACGTIKFLGLDIEPAADCTIQKCIEIINSTQVDFESFSFEDNATTTQSDAAYFEFVNATSIHFDKARVSQNGSASKILFSLATTTCENITFRDTHIISTQTGMTLFNLADVAHFSTALESVSTTLSAAATGVNCAASVNGLEVTNWEDLGTQPTFTIDAQDFIGINIPGAIAITERDRQVLINCAGTISGTGAESALRLNSNATVKGIRGYLKNAVSSDRGNNSITLTPNSSDAHTQIFNTAITADRTVTLSTTDALNGMSWRIVRGAGATGAFNINVGTGPLKALGTAGTWCDVEYNGAAWLLTAAGSL